MVTLRACTSLEAGIGFAGGGSFEATAEPGAKPGKTGKEGVPRGHRLRPDALRTTSAQRAALPPGYMRTGSITPLRTAEIPSENFYFF